MVESLRLLTDWSLVRGSTVWLCALLSDGKITFDEFRLLMSLIPPKV